MKKILISMLSLLLVVIVAGAVDVPNFAFPRQVSAEALVQLNKAVKSGDGKTVVDALVRYSLAQSSISKQQIDSLMPLIEQQAQQERHPDIKALLYHLEASVLYSYYNRYGGQKEIVDTLPSRYDRWSKGQINDKLHELVNLSLNDEKTLLGCPLRNYSDIIKEDSLGMCKSLFQFLALQGYLMVNEDDVLRRLMVNCDPGSELHMLAVKTSLLSPLHLELLGVEEPMNGSEVAELYYDKYKASESAGMLLPEIDDEELWEDYVARYPNGRHTPAVKNKISRLKTKSLKVRPIGECTPRDSIKLWVDSKNVDAFKLNFYRINDDVKDQRSYKEDDLTLVLTKEITVDENVDYYMLPPQSYGRYLVDYSFNDEFGQEVSRGDEIECSTINVHDLMLMGFSYKDKEDDVHSLLAVDMTSGTPIAGATVSSDKWTGVSDGDGMVTHRGHFLYETPYTVSKDKDKWGRLLNMSNNYYDEGETITADFYTNLSIFSPGETVNFVGILYSITPKHRKPVAGKEVIVELRDPNSELVEETRLVSDNWGRVAGAFTLPKDRMNGDFSILCKLDKTHNLVNKYIKVSEYKIPSIMVDLDEQHPYHLGEDVVIGGTVISYSGMPISGAKVSLEVEYNSWRYEERELPDTTLVTDANGRFELKIPADSFNVPEKKILGDSDYVNDNTDFYSYSVEAVNDQGEMCESGGIFEIILKAATSVEAEKAEILLDGNKADFPAKLSSNTNEVVPVLYKLLKPDGQEVFSGEVMSNNLKVDWNKFPSGIYDFEVWTATDTIHDTSEVLLYRLTDKHCYLEDTPLWLMPGGSKVAKNGKGEVLIGTSVKESHIYYIASTSDGIISSGWLHYKPGIHKFALKLPKNLQEAVKVNFYNVYNKAFSDEGVQLQPIAPPVKLDVKIESFRNKLVPGDKERWSFTLIDNKNNKQQGALMLEMVDKAIDDLYSNEWSAEFDMWDEPLFNFQAQDIYAGAFYGGPQLYWHRPWLEERKILVPKLNTYHRGWFNVMTIDGIGFGLKSTKVTSCDSTGYTVTGWVYYDEDFEPIIGANVHEKERPIHGTATDMDGKFTLVVPSLNGSILVRYIGTKDYELKLSSLPQVILLGEDDETALQEVVVTGYGVESKRLYTGSSTADVGKLLEGRAAGVMVSDDEDGEVSYQKVTELNIVADDAVSKISKENARKALLKQMKTRELGVKTALWKPLLTTDENGRFTVEFTAPENNSTWIVQAIAYNKDMISGSRHEEVVTSRPLMVKPVAPRFLRHGDKVTLKAQVQNADDTTATVDAVVEMFDLNTNAVLHSVSEQLTLSPQESRNVEITWTVPDTLALVGMRVKAATERWGDGEQLAIPVLEAVSPVIEAKPFYIEPGESRNVTIPTYPDRAKVSIETCENPLWYTIMALPTIYSDNDYIATSIAHSLYAQSIAQDLASCEPKIASAIRSWQGDSTVTSMLRLNPSLKIGNLKASPFVRAAQRESLRMQQLGNLLDTTKMKTEHERLVKALGKLQQSDGGWAWFNYPGCESSLWTTMEVLQLIAEQMMITTNLSDTTLNSMVQRAVRYCDKTIADDLKAGKHVDYMAFAYVRSFFPQFKMDKSVRALCDRSIKAVVKNWKNYSLISRAYAAIVLARNGNEAEARKIVQSLCEHAVIDQWGMHWDYLQEGYAAWDDKVTLTARVLEAIALVDPQEAEIQQIHKWLLLMKQSNDWGSSSMAAQAVYVLLTTGDSHGWMTDSLGYSARDVAPGTTINFNKKAHPQWGAIYAAYSAPMEKVKAASTHDINITKRMMRYGSDGKLEEFTTLKVGDKVQVRITLDAAKDLDYVTVSDERAACFEPVDKTSGYYYNDGIFYYNEVKDSKTNIFITSVRRGIHTVTYDVMVTNVGAFATGVAQAQSQYSPQAVAHTAASTIIVE
ncbi:MAG: alpha-2-macroglobulin family protein [Bacteroidales bacterium]|nr:alpha-2-macroglobulin family protein [Bacteroidales bacterium]